VALSVDDIGIVVATLRPAGQAQFEKAIADVVTEGEFIDKGESVMIIEIHGNRVVVRKAN
jgi:membrane-bound serine protease (ClpP class)